MPARAICTGVVVLIGLLNRSPAVGQTGNATPAPEVAIGPPCYEYNIPPDSGADTGVRTVEFLKGALTDRSDSGVMWSNGGNRPRSPCRSVLSRSARTC